MLNKIFEKWVEITEVSPDCNIITNRNVDIYRYNQRMKELLKYDGDLMDAVILMDAFLTRFLQSRSVSLFDIYNKNNALAEKLKSVMEMKELIDSYNVSEYYDELIKTYKEALEAYEINDEKVSEVLNNREDLIELKVNALYAYKALEPKQFKRGEYSDKTPKYNKNIYAFYDINILLNAVMNNDEFNGITLNLIIDKESFESSYFCFVIKNGENVYLMGDIPNYSHPNQKYMRRTPGRQMEGRIEMFNFPYELLALTGDKYGVRSESTALSIYSEYNIIGTLSDCNPYSVIWIINMMSILKDKFFDNHIQTEKTYYTGGMIEMAGIEQKEYSLAIKKDYEILDMDRISKREAVDCKIEYSRPQRGETAWIVDRYIDKIDDCVINNMSNEDRIELSSETALSIVDKKETVDILSENYSTVGTKEDFEYRQKWMSRYNLAQAVNVLFKKEWREKRAEIDEWYLDMLNKNAENILRYIALGEFISEEHNYQQLTESGKAKYARGEKYNIFSTGDKDVVTFGRELNVREINLLSIDVYDEDRFDRLRGSTILCKKDKRNLKYGWKYGCYVDGKTPGIVARFKITSPKAIADICGVKIEELPDFLQHYCKTSDFHDGNCILDNIDPMDWVIKNYIHEFFADVSVVLSKTTYNNLRKQYGLEPNKIWLQNNDND